VSWTKIFVAPSGYEAETPYYAGIITFAKGNRAPMQFVDFVAEPVIGQKIITVVRRSGRAKPQEIIAYGIKAKPF